MENKVHRFVYKKVLRNILFDEAVIFVPRKMLDIGLAAGDEIIDADHAMAFCKEAICEVRGQKSGAAGDESCLLGR